MSLFPDIWWQSPPSDSSGNIKVKAKVNNHVHSRHHYHQPNHHHISGEDQDENGIAPTTQNSKTSNNNNGHGDAVVIHSTYGSTIQNNYCDYYDLGTKNSRLRKTTVSNTKTTTTTMAPSLYEEGEPTLLPMVYSPSLVDKTYKKDDQHRDDNVPSDISSASTIDNNNNNDDDDDIDDETSIEIIEQPHRTMGLIFFDFIRCIAISANVRCLNTQLMPIFMSMGGGMGGNNKKSNNNQLDMLSVTLRLFISLFSILLILVEFPDVFPFLQHALPSHETTTSRRPSEHATSSKMSSSSSTTTAPNPPQQLLPPTTQSLLPTSSQPPLPPPLYISNWIPRGIFYIFLSIICLEQSLVVRAFDNERHVNSYSRFFDGFFIVVSAYIMAATGIVYVLLGMCCCQRIMERVRRDEKEKWRVYYEKVMEMELQDEEEEEEDEEEERRKLLSSSSSSLEWVKEKKDANGKRRKVRLRDGEEESQQEKQNVIGWVQWYCFGRCCWQRWLRWWRRNRWQQRKSRRRQRQHQTKGCGLCRHMGCRTVDWRL